MTVNDLAAALAVLQAQGKGDMLCRPADEDHNQYDIFEIAQAWDVEFNDKAVVLKFS